MEMLNLIPIPDAVSRGSSILLSLVLSTLNRDLLHSEMGLLSIKT